VADECVLWCSAEAKDLQELLVRAFTGGLHFLFQGTWSSFFSFLSVVSLLFSFRVLCVSLSGRTPFHRCISLFSLVNEMIHKSFACLRKKTWNFQVVWQQNKRNPKQMSKIMSWVGHVEIAKHAKTQSTCSTVYAVIMHISAVTNTMCEDYQFLITYFWFEHQVW